MGIQSNKGLEKLEGKKGCVFKIILDCNIALLCNSSSYIRHPADAQGMFKAKLWVSLGFKLGSNSCFASSHK